MLIFVFANSPGELTKIRIWHDNKFLGASWFLESVEIIDESTNETFLFPCKRWLAKDKDDGSLVRELTCANPKKSVDSRSPSSKSRGAVLLNRRKINLFTKPQAAQVLC